ncbi:MAG: GNAT family N-acetyltransferase [Burkholderiaceae bacterium]
MNIRPATPDDLAAICALGKDVNDLHSQAYPWAFVRLNSPDDAAEHWQRSMVGPQTITLVACVQDQVVGFVNAALARDEHVLLFPTLACRIGSVAVRAAHQGKGIGHALMDAIECWARENGAQDLRLNVWNFNQRAIKLYEELGFEMRAHTMGKRLQLNTEHA